MDVGQFEVAEMLVKEFNADISGLAPEHEDMCLEYRRAHQERRAEYEFELANQKHAAQQEEKQAARQQARDARPAPRQHVVAPAARAQDAEDALNLSSLVAVLNGGKPRRRLPQRTAEQGGHYQALDGGEPEEAVRPENLPNAKSTQVCIIS
jgi:hypothetical protein